MTSKERIAYLEGLLEGLKVEDEDTRRVYEAIVEALRAYPRRLRSTKRY